MKKLKFNVLLMALLVLSGCNQQKTPDISTDADKLDYYEFKKQPGSSDFDFPGNYVEPELNVDGKDDEAEWAGVTESLTFGTANKARMRLFRGENALYAFFNVKDPDLQVVGDNDGDDVTKGDSIEIYFDFLNDGAKKPQSDDIQINIGVHGRTRIFVGSSGEWGLWNGLLDYAINIDGTLNSSESEMDVDKGYNVEIMIPYKQVGITKESTFGVSVGCVSKGTDSTHDTLPYTWSGITYEGNFIDPQKPDGYIVYQGDKYYARDKLPLPNKIFTGHVYDQGKVAVDNADVTIDGETVKTDVNGLFTFTSLNPNINQEIVISKTGYDAFNYTIPSAYLREEDNKDFIVIDSNKEFKSLIKGIVKNPADGVVSNAKIEFADETIYTDANGAFSHEIIVGNDVSFDISKDAYKTSNYNLDVVDLAGNAIYDMGDVAIYSYSSNFTFAGSRPTNPLIKGEVYRAFDGIFFKFESDDNIVNGSHIELFIDSGYTNPITRDTTDYRIDFNGDGDVSIVNFGDGTNDSVGKSGITNNAYLLGTKYYIEAFIPYEFLGVSVTDIIGFSCGSWNGPNADWDGMGFDQEGFEGYVAPEYPEQYLRVGLDNGLYRALSNEVVAYKVYGTVKDGSGNVLTGAYINSNNINEDGSYRIYDIGSNGTITVTCNGYLSQTFNYTKADATNNKINHDFVLALATCEIVGTITCKQDGLPIAGVKVYVQGDETNCVYTDLLGAYSITVCPDANITLVYEISGYENTTKTIAKTALVTAASKNEPYQRDMSMNQE